MESKKFRHIPTGEIVTQVPISKFSEYEEVEDDKTEEPNTNQDFIKSHFIIGGIKK